VRVVLDTNVIVAAFAARGLCAEVFEVCASSQSIILSEHIITETRKALLGKIKLPGQIADELLFYLRDTCEFVEPGHIDKSICRDPDDLAIIGTAVKGRAEFIVTGDAHLLQIKDFRGIKIVTPREFWDLAQRGKRPQP
jgi:putative PIN family toxin of toxin-antitoxin system